MATVTRTVADTSGASADRATWTYIIDYENIVVTGDTFTVKIPSIIAKYLASVSKNAISYFGQEACFIGSTKVFDAVIGRREFQYLANNTFGALDAAYIYGTEYGTIDQTNKTVTLKTSDWFGPTVGSIPLVFRAEQGTTLQLGSGYLMNPTDPDERYFERYSEYVLSAPGALVTINAIIDAPPKVTLGTPTYSSPQYAGLGEYSINVMNAEAQLGATIYSIALKIGSQLSTKYYSTSTVANEEFTLTPAVAGQFTPAIIVTDSRGQAKEIPLSPITVNQYNAPSMSFGIARCDSNGALNIEGQYGLVTASITYTDTIAKLTQPAVSVQDENGHAVLSDAVWYETWDTANGVSDPVDWNNYNPASPVSLFAIVSATHSALSPSMSYIIGITPTDNKAGVAQTITQTLSTAFYTIDFKAGGKEIAFGSPANDTLTQTQESIGLFKCAMDTAFNDMTSQEVEDFVDSVSGTGADIIDILSPCYMELRLTANTTMSISSAWTYVKIPLDRIERSYGTGLTFTSNSIQIDKAGYYMISASAVGSRPNYIQLRLNSTLISQNISNEATWEGYGFGSYVIKCNAGDTISLWITKTTNTNPSVAGAPATNLTVAKLPWIV